MSPQQINGAQTWSWPTAVTTVHQLLAAMRAGFDLRQLPESKNFGLFRDGKRSPGGIFDDTCAVIALRRGYVGLVGKSSDGGLLFMLTTKASGR